MQNDSAVTKTFLDKTKTWVVKTETKIKTSRFKTKTYNFFQDQDLFAQDQDQDSNFLKYQNIYDQSQKHLKVKTQESYSVWLINILILQ